jgi:ubiquinone/menaquinone biosynthesis C-methylase UbiE
MERYAIRGGRAGYERLQLLARTAQPETSDLLDRAGAARLGACCLDLGCGSGDVTLELARRAGPGGRATGIDEDAVKLDLARRAATEAGLANADFIVGSVYDWTEPASYDLVYCRFLLHHLSRPIDVLRAMWAGLRPGGVVVVEDADFFGGFCDPPSAAYDFLIESYSGVLARRGGDAMVAQRLFGLFLEAGIPNANVSVRQRVHVSGEAKWLMHGTLEATSEAIVSEGIASKAAVDAALANLAAHTGDPSSVIAEPRTFQVWATRPDSLP